MDIARHEDAHKLDSLLEQRWRLRGRGRLRGFRFARGAGWFHLLDFLKLALHRLAAFKQGFKLLGELVKLQRHAGFFLYVAL